MWSNYAIFDNLLRDPRKLGWAKNSSSNIYSINNISKSKWKISSKNGETQNTKKVQDRPGRRDETGRRMTGENPSPVAAYCKSWMSVAIANRYFSQPWKTIIHGNSSEKGGHLRTAWLLFFHQPARWEIMR